MVNTIISKQNDKSNIIEYLKVGNVETYNAKEITRQFGKIFLYSRRKICPAGTKPKNINKPLHTKNTPKPSDYISYPNMCYRNRELDKNITK